MKTREELVEALKIIAEHTHDEATRRVAREAIAADERTAALEWLAEQESVGLKPIRYMLPILVNHNQSRIVGEVKMEHGKLMIEFADEVFVSKEHFETIFGNCGYRMIDYSDKSGTIQIKKAEILEFSLSLSSGAHDRVG